MIMPAIGMMTVSDKERIMLKILPFQPCGVCPIGSAIVAVFSLTSANMVIRLLSIEPMKKDLIDSSIMSSRPDIRSLSEHACQERNQLDPDQYDSATSHELFDPLALCARVVVAVSFKQVDDAPDGQTRP